MHLNNESVHSSECKGYMQTYAEYAHASCICDPVYRNTNGLHISNNEGSIIDVYNGIKGTSYTVDTSEVEHGENCIYEANNYDMEYQDQCKCMVEYDDSGMPMEDGDTAWDFDSSTVADCNLGPIVSKLSIPFAHMHTGKYQCENCMQSGNGEHYSHTEVSRYLINDHGLFVNSYADFKVQVMKFSLCPRCWEEYE